MKKASIPLKSSNASLHLRGRAKKSKGKDDLFKVMDKAGKMVKSNGLTEEKLQKILIELEAGSF